MQAWHIWLILAIFLAIVEIFTPGFVVLCFAAGGLLASLVALIGLSATWQILAFAAGTFAAFVSVRPFMQNWALRKSQHVPTNVDRLVNQQATVLEPVDDDAGLVKIGGEEWSARSADGQRHRAGKKVRVVRVEGNKVFVSAQ